MGSERRSSASSSRMRNCEVQEWVKEEGNGEADRVRKRLASYGGGPVGLARGVTTIGGGSIRSWTSKKRRGELLPRHPTRNTARLHGDHL